MFACAAMTCREKFLLSHEKIDRMLAGRSVPDALRILRELDYDDRVENAGMEYEKVLLSELEKTYKLVISMVPDETYFDVLLLPNDYHNVKVLLKAEFLEINADDLLIDAGTYPLDELKALVSGRNYSDMSEEMAAGIQSVLETYGTTQDPQVVDLILDKACYRDMSFMARILKMDFINDYLTLKIDTVNLISFARARQMKSTREFFSKIFIEDGNVPEEVFLDCFSENTEKIAEKVAIYGLDSVATEGFQMLEKTGRFTVLEKLCDDLLLSFVETAKQITSGVEPLYAYLLAKESEIKTVRIILAGLFEGLPTEQIRERVRNTYA